MAADAGVAAEHQSHRAHRAKREGRKGTTQDGRNPKAFAAASGRKANILGRRNAQLEQHRLHVPAVDRTFGLPSGAAVGRSATTSAAASADAPPVIVAIAGPSGVGKSTLLRSLVRRYTKTSVTDITGPATVVASKTRRLTFVEVPNSIGAAIDVTKVADLVLLVIDGSFGFEMDTFEMIGALQAHGMPKVVAVLTHLDLIRQPEALRAQKKRLKQRFWTEAHDGAKVFHLSGVWNGRYPDREIVNLSRYINVAKFRPLAFRNQHSYLLADRYEDVTPREQVRLQPTCDRTITLSGFLRGLPLRVPSSASEAVRLHLPGSGIDVFEAVKVEALADPCALPSADAEKRRKMSERHRLLYAPMSSGAGSGLHFDGDRLWIATKGGDESARDGEIGVGDQMLVDLHRAGQLLGEAGDVSAMRFAPSDDAEMEQRPDAAELSEAASGDDDSGGLSDQDASIASQMSDEDDEDGDDDDGGGDGDDDAPPEIASDSAESSDAFLASSGLLAARDPRYSSVSSHRRPASDLTEDGERRRAPPPMLVDPPWKARLAERAVDAVDRARRRTRAPRLADIVYGAAR